MSIKLKKTDILNNVIINNDITNMIINMIGIQNKGYKEEKYIPFKFFKNHQYNVTYDFKNIKSGLIIFTFLNNQRTILYYNYSVFYIIYFNDKNIYYHDDNLFYNKIFNAKKINNENLFIIDDKPNDNLIYEKFMNDNNIYFKKHVRINEIKSLLHYINTLYYSEHINILTFTFTSTFASSSGRNYNDKIFFLNI